MRAACCDLHDVQHQVQVSGPRGRVRGLRGRGPELGECQPRDPDLRGLRLRPPLPGQTRQPRQVSQARGLDTRAAQDGPKSLQLWGQQVIALAMIDKKILDRYRY